MSPTLSKLTPEENLGKMYSKRSRVRKIGNYVTDDDPRLNYYVKSGNRIMGERFELVGFEEENQYPVVESEFVVKENKIGHLNIVDKCNSNLKEGKTNTLKLVPIREGLLKQNLSKSAVGPIKSPAKRLVNNNISINKNKDLLISPPQLIRLEPAPASITDNMQTIELITKQKPTTVSSSLTSSPDDFVNPPDLEEPLLGGNNNPRKLLSAKHLAILSEVKMQALNLSMKREARFVSIGVQTEEVSDGIKQKDANVQTETPCNKPSFATYEDSFPFNNSDGFGECPVLNDVNFGSGPLFPALAVNFSNNMGYSINSEHDWTFSADGYMNKPMMFFKDLRECLTYNIEGNLPIHEAVINNNISLVQQHCVALRTRKQSINLKNHSGCTSLQLAVIHNADIQIVEKLLNAGANIEERDEEGNNIFHLLAQFERINVLQYILKYCKVYNLFECANRHNYNGFTPLMICCMSSWTLGAKHFIKAGVKVDVQDQSSGRTALFHASEVQNVELVKILLENKADPKIKNFFGTSPHDAMYELEDIDEGIKGLIFGKTKKRSHEAELNPIRTAKAVKSLPTFSKLQRLDSKTIINVETVPSRAKHIIQRHIK